MRVWDGTLVRRRRIRLHPIRLANQEYPVKILPGRTAGCWQLNAAWGLLAGAGVIDGWMDGTPRGYGPTLIIRRERLVRSLPSGMARPIPSRYFARNVPGLSSAHVMRIQRRSAFEVGRDRTHRHDRPNADGNGSWHAIRGPRG
jgi:hypothetical protein